jgi:hypothetical protein
MLQLFKVTEDTDLNEFEVPLFYFMIVEFERTVFKSGSLVPCYGLQVMACIQIGDSTAC